MNKFFRAIQAKVQGIPKISAKLYEASASKLLEHMYEAIANEIRDRKNKILDVGCGTGKLLLKIVKSEKAIFAVGLDISNAMLSIAKRKLVKENIYNLVLGDAHNMPFRHSSVNLILSSGTLHHLRYPGKFFKECFRVFGKEGEAWIYEFSHDAPSSEVKETSKLLKKPSLLLKSGCYTTWNT